MQPLSPVDLLPSELLAAIFLQGLEPYTLSDQTVAAKRQDWLSRICVVSKLFKDVAYSTPDLWSLIHIGFIVVSDSLENPYQRNKLHLNNAKTVLLDVALDIPVILLSTPPEWPLFWKCWDEIRARADRWRSIRINRIIIRTGNEVNTLLPASLPNLLEAEFASISPLMSPFISAPRLRLLRVEKPGFIPFTSTEALHTLHATGYIIDFNVLLQQSTCLHTLEVDHYFFSYAEISWDIHLKLLRRFKAVGNLGLLGNFLAQLTAPNLEVISLVADELNPPDHVEIFSDIHFPSLTTIEYESEPTAFLNPLRSFLTMFRETSTLTIKLTMGDIQSLESYNADVRWIEQRVARVVWRGRENESVDLTNLEGGTLASLEASS